MSFKLLLFTLAIICHSVSATSLRCRLTSCSSCVSKGCFFSKNLGSCVDECDDNDDCYGKYPGIPPPFNLRGCPGSGQCNGFISCESCVDALCFWSLSLSSGNSCASECSEDGWACFTKNAISSLQQLCPSLPSLAPSYAPTSEPVVETRVMWIAPHACSNITCFSIASQPLGASWEDYEGVVAGASLLLTNKSIINFIYQVEAKEIQPFASPSYLLISKKLDMLPQNPRFIRALWISSRYVNCTGLFSAIDPTPLSPIRKPGKGQTSLDKLWSLRGLVLTSPIAQKFQSDHEYFLGLLRGDLFKQDSALLYKITTSLALLEIIALQTQTTLTSLQLSSIGFQTFVLGTTDADEQIQLLPSSPFVIAASLLIQQLVPARLFSNIDVWTQYEFQMLQSAIWLVWEAQNPAPPGLCLQYRFSPQGPLQTLQGRIRGFVFVPSDGPSQHIEVRESLDGDPLYTFLYYCSPRLCKGFDCIFASQVNECSTLSPTRFPTFSPTSRSPTTAFPSSSPTSASELIWKQSGFPSCGMCGTTQSVYQTVFCYNTVIKIYLHDRFCQNIIPRPSQVKSCADDCTSISPILSVSSFAITSFPTFGQTLSPSVQFTMYSAPSRMPQPSYTWVTSGFPTCPTLCGQKPAIVRQRVFCLNITANQYVRGSECKALGPRPSQVQSCPVPDCSQSVAPNCSHPEKIINCGGCAESICGIVQSCNLGSCEEGCQCDARMHTEIPEGCEVCARSRDYDYDVLK